MPEFLLGLTAMSALAAVGAWCADRVPETWVDAFTRLMGAEGKSH